MDLISRSVGPDSVLRPLNLANSVKTTDKMESVFTPLSFNEPVNQVNPIMTESFEKVLSRALEPVNNLQLQSADLDAKLASGKLEYVHEAMVMAQKASLALDLTIQLRNKVVEAYQEIMRTQI